LVDPGVLPSPNSMKPRASFPIGWMPLTDTNGQPNASDCLIVHSDGVWHSVVRSYRRHVGGIRCCGDV